MQLYIDPTGGIAGDMFAAALVSAGADKQMMEDAMYAAAAKIGKASVEAVLTVDGCTRLQIDVDHLHQNLSGHQARHLLATIFEELEMAPVYREFGMRALQILIEAEKKAHSENHFLTDHHHGHDEHSHHHVHPHLHGHVHDHHHHEPEAYLHEAQDILIDITGAAYGLQLLDAPVVALLLAPVSLGGGIVKFSHGEMSVPAPATKIILQSNWIPAQMGPIDTELCTPTGASLLAALKAVNVVKRPDGELVAMGKSRGGKDLPIPPLTVSVFE